MTFTILLVCSANVCRSPLAAVVLANRLALAGLTAQVTIRSLGVNAVTGLGGCPEMIEAGRARGIGVEAMVRHRSRLLKPESVDSADLVLTADRETRAAVVRLNHSAHSRTFTLRESATLGTLVTWPRPGVRTGDTAAHLRDFVDELNDVRGLTELPRDHYTWSPSRPWRRVKVHSHDIPDAHQNLTRLHRITFGLTVTSSGQVAESLVSWAHATGRRDSVG